MLDVSPVNPLATALLYGIVDLGYIAARDACAVAERMCAGGVDVIQLRAKGTDEHAIEALGNELIRVTEPAGVPLIINDHPHLVPSIGAQGAHVGQDDFAVEDARWRAGRSLAGEEPPPIIGKSTHSFAQAVAAAAEGADYLGFGPLFPTPTKPGRPAIGLADIRRVHEALTLPIFCIGGIKRENLDTVLDAGARRVVIVSGILQAPDIEGYCRDVKARLQIADCGLRIAD
ncbi:MAG: thiamine-phosphate pyrophosphorylase [Chthoniobacter sp.]|jgi:thiamine-phosphate pyrophosphorylase|nr:thiamine-phosphate pyrophosphorylase [Chthoniobacter sp.]